MLNINQTAQSGTVSFELEGRLDTISASEFDAAVNKTLAEAKAVIFDFTKLEYLSSAGLRILLTAQQTMEETGRPDVTVRGASDEIKGIFAITGFDNVLNIE